MGKDPTRTGILEGRKVLEKKEINRLGTLALVLRQFAWGWGRTLSGTIGIAQPINNGISRPKCFSKSYEICGGL